MKGGGRRINPDERHMNAFIQMLNVAYAAQKCTSKKTESFDSVILWKLKSALSLLKFCRGNAALINVLHFPS